MVSIKTKRGFEIEIPNEFNGYKFIEFISNGAFSVVAKVQDIENGKYYAAKVISMTDMEERNLIKTISNEINILRSIEHPNIISIYETFFIQSGNGENMFVIVTDYCPNGDLVQYISNTGFKNDQELKEIEYEILIGLEYLHDQGIAHCDIKPDNILLDENMKPIICDFGLSKFVDQENEGIINGALQYSSPELFENGDVDYLKADVWAIGITFYIISELKLPYIGGTTIKTGKLSINSANESLNKFVEKCTKMNPEERPSVYELLDDEFFATIYEEEYSSNEESCNYDKDNCNKTELSDDNGSVQEQDAIDIVDSYAEEITVFDEKDFDLEDMSIQIEEVNLLH